MDNYVSSSLPKLSTTVIIEFIFKAYSYDTVFYALVDDVKPNPKY